MRQPFVGAAGRQGFVEQGGDQVAVRQARREIDEAGPDDLAAVFKKNKAETDFFNKLSFSNRKEYLEWIVTAKRPETRKQRVEGTIERLEKGWKNPANR